MPEKPSLLKLEQKFELTNENGGVIMVVDGRKGKSILPYGRFIQLLLDDLMEMLRVMENLEWHHLLETDEKSIRI